MSKSDLAAKLEQIRKKRGYLLPHHGLMAITAPGLLSAYDTLYSEIALEPRRLSEHDREFVWLAILIAKDELLATHHVAKFLEAGGSNREIEVIVGLAAWARGSGAYDFVTDHWAQCAPGLDPASAAKSTFDSLAEDTTLALAHMACLAAQTCAGHWRSLKWQIQWAYADGVDELDLAEALSLMMFPGSVPYFVRAARVWQELIIAGTVEASSEFVTWANLAGQGGYDEANR